MHPVGVVEAMADIIGVEVPASGGKVRRTSPDSVYVKAVSARRKSGNVRRHQNAVGGLGHRNCSYGRAIRPGHDGGSGSADALWLG